MSETASDAIRVLVVDDSALMRNLIGKIVESADDCTVVATAMNGEFALNKLPRVEPDCVVLDLEMPKMNGIQFLTRLREIGSDVPVIILSSVAERGARITMEALALGAADFITKPSGSVSHDIHVVGEQLIAMIRGYGGAHRSERGLRTLPAPADHAVSTYRVPIETAPVAPAPKKPTAKPGKLEVIAIGISTGGPNALRQVFAEIDGEIGVPILIVQHMPAGFTAEFAASLDRISALEVKEASDGDILSPNRVLVAPGDHHIEVERRKLATVARLSQADQVNGHRPSADVLFKSVAAAFGNSALGVIMTGMGRDGAREIGAIYEAGGITIGQDEASCVVYGMPRVAAEYGFLTRQVALDDMATTINEYAREFAHT